MRLIFQQLSCAVSVTFTLCFTVRTHVQVACVIVRIPSVEYYEVLFSQTGYIQYPYIFFQQANNCALTLCPVPVACE